MARLLGIDIGTSATKAVVIDETGNLHQSVSEEYPLITPRPGWAEQDPEDWWRAVQLCLAAIQGPIDAIGLTGQMHGSVFLDGQGSVLRPALLWCDQRTAQECAEIDSTCGPEVVRSVTCNPPLPGFQLPKILWLRNNERHNFDKVARVLLPKDFIAHRLTGQVTSEPSDASGTGVFDVKRRQWSRSMLEQLSLDPSWFPDCVESSVVVGSTEKGTPVVAGAGDQAAGAVGVGVVVPGIMSLSMGTSGVAFGCVRSPDPDPSGSAHVFCHANGGWHAMGVTLSFGGAVRWARDTLFGGLSFDQLAVLASEAKAGCDGVAFLTYLAGERCPDLAVPGLGCFAGMSLSTTKGDMARSVFEGASFALAGCVESLGRLGIKAERLRITGGGANSEFWSQMVADVVEKPCVTLSVDEGPAFGAAILAGVGIGLWPNVERACEETVREQRVFEPSIGSYRGAYRVHKALYPALKDWSNTSHTIE